MPVTLSTQSRKRQRLELLALPVLIAIAAWLWTAPLRTERYLSQASPQELQAYTREHPGSARAFYYLGISLQKKNEVGSASQAFAHAATLDPADENAWLAWAAVAGAVNGEQETFNILGHYIKAHPGSARAHFALAQLYQQNHAHKRAFEEASEAARLNPNDSEAWRTAAVEAMSWNNLPAAEQDARRAIAAKPGDWRGYKTCGDVLQAMKQPVEAETAYRNAVKLAPSQAIAQLALGRMLLQAATTPQEIQAALQNLTRAAQLDATFPLTFLLLGQAEARQEHWIEARTALEQAERLDPSSADVAFELARVYRRVGDSVAAAHATRRHEELRDFALQKYTLVSRLESQPENTTVRLQIARLCTEHNEYSEALYYYRSLLARSPQNNAARQELAALQASHEQQNFRTASTATLLEEGRNLLDQKRYEEAKQAYLPLLKRDPKSALAYQGVGLALDGQGKDEAFYFLEHAVRLNSQLPEAQFVLGEMFNEAGFTDEAARRLRIAIHANPNRADYWRALGRAYSVLTFTYAQSEEAYRHAVTLAPGKAIYLLDLAEMEQENHKEAQAESDARRALVLAPEDAETISRVGGVLFTAHADAAGRHEAEILLDKALEKNPSDDVARFNLAQLALDRNDARQAIRDLEGIVARSPTAGDIWYVLSRAYARIGDEKRSKLALANSQNLHSEYQEVIHTEEMIRSSPKNGALHLRLARLNARRGSNAKAINQYELYLHLKPGDSAVKTELAELEGSLKSAGRMPSMPLFNAMVASLSHAG